MCSGAFRGRDEGPPALSRALSKVKTRDNFISIKTVVNEAGKRRAVSLLRNQSRVVGIWEISRKLQGKREGHPSAKMLAVCKLR